jgi:hypothetical protein
MMGSALMTGDAKLGLLLGIGVVVAAALMYYRPDVGNKDTAAVKAEVQNGARPVQLSPSPKLTVEGRR